MTEIIYLSLHISDDLESFCNMEYPGKFPGSGRSPAEGNVCPFQYSCLEFYDTDAQWAIVILVTKM